MLGPILVTLHNLRFFQRLMDDLREAINSNEWESFKRNRPSLAPIVDRAIEVQSQSD